MTAGAQGRPARARGHGELLAALLNDARDCFRDAGRAWDPGRPGVDRLPDYGRGILDAYACALHVLWTYQGAWADEGFLATARLPESGQRLLELLGLRPDPGAAATGWQAVRCVQGREGTIPPGFAVRAPAAAGRPAQTYETLRARRVSWRLNELRAVLPVPAGTTGLPGSTAGSIAAVATTGGAPGQGPSPFPLPSTAGALADRLQAARAGTLAQRQAAHARQTALRLADLARELAPHATEPGCDSTFAAMCHQLAQNATAAGVVPQPDPGPLSQSQELLVGLLAKLAAQNPSALGALDAALGQCAGEADDAWARRLDQAAAFLDRLVAGLLQHARDQVVLLHGSDALERVDAAAAAAGEAGEVAPGTDGLYLAPDAVGTHTGLLGPGDWLVVGEDVVPGTDAAQVAADGRATTVRVFRQAVQIVRLREEVPAGRTRAATHVTFRPPLDRRYRLATLVLLGNVLKVSHGATVRESGVRLAADGPYLRPGTGPLTWLRDASPSAVDGRVPAMELTAVGRDWRSVPDLADARPGDPVFAVEPQPGQQVRLRMGDGVKGAPLAPGAGYELRYRVGVGVVGNADAGAVHDLAGAHPAVLDTTNPLPIVGGVDPEPFERTRAKARAGLSALSRAVSAADVASLACTFGGVRQAAVLRGSPGRRRVLSVVACGEGGAALEPAEQMELRAFLLARTAPGTSIEVRNRMMVPVRLAVRLHVTPGDDPLAVIRQAQLRLGAAPARPPGVLDPAGATLGRDLDLSDVYQALDGIPGLAAAVVTALHRDTDERQPELAERIPAGPGELVVLARPAAAVEPLALSWAEAVDL